MAETKQMSREEIIGRLKVSHRGFVFNGDDMRYEAIVGLQGIGEVTVGYSVGRFHADKPFIIFDVYNPSQLIQAYRLYTALQGIGVGEVDNVPVTESEIRVMRSYAEKLEHLADVLNFQNNPNAHAFLKSLGGGE